MEWLWWTLGALGALAVLVLLVAFYCYMRVFYSPGRKPLGDGEYEIPDGEEYIPYREAMIGWVKAARELPHEDVEITSRDGLTLRGKYYEYEAGAPVEILFHGYQGNGERDMSAGIERCFALGRSALIVDHRASGRSDGHTITFGIKERLDCVDWARFAAEKFGSERRLVITGISMGGATVTMAAADPDLPPSVVCALADCPYSSAREIIMKVIGDMHLPPRLVYPFVRLGALLFGRFDPDEYSPREGARAARIPIIYIHGGADGFVPHEMSLTLHSLTATKSAICIIDGAAHGLAFPTDKEKYLAALADFQTEFLTV